MPHDIDPHIEFRRLPEVDPAAIIALMNDPAVRRHMPLARGDFDAARCASFVAAKERLWAAHGYGPWAFLVNGEFAGWGGLQPEGADIDIGLVLHPRFWGVGRRLYAGFVETAFADLGATSVIIMLPPSRTRVAGVRRLGFQPDGEVDVAGARFVRYRLTRL